MIIRQAHQNIIRSTLALYTYTLLWGGIGSPSYAKSPQRLDPDADYTDDSLACSKWYPAPVENICHDNFPEKTSGELWIMLFSSHACANCKYVERGFINMAVDLQNNRNVRVGIVNCYWRVNYRSLCRDHKVDALPTLRIINNGTFDTYAQPRQSMEDIDQLVKTKLAEWVPGERRPDSSIATKSVQETSGKASDATLHSDEVCKRTTPADMTTEDLEAELERRKAEELSSSGVSSPCAHLNRQSADVNSVEQVVILGGGPAGLTAAIYAARSGLCPLVISPEFGGQLMMKGVAVENYPALPRGSGLDMIFMMRRQAESFGAELRNEAVAAVHITTASGRPRDTFVVLTNKSVSINTKTIIIATGANTQWLGVPGEDRLRGRGVTTCAACDGYLYRGKRCSVVGGGDSALEDALMLLRLCEKVTIIHRRDSFRASQVLQTRVRESEVEVLWNHKVVGFIEDPATSQLGRVSLMNSNTGERTIIDVDATFIAIGYAPNTNMFKGQLEMLPGGSGYLTTQGKSTATSVPGVFAAGDVADPTYRQAVTSAGSGAQAALDAERWLNEQPSSV